MLGRFRFTRVTATIDSMIPRTVSVWKEVGETPLAALERLRVERPELADLPLTYAGRLDPLAEGTLLVLVGDECKRQGAYRNLDKKYEIEVLLDVSTDTGDVLGIPVPGSAHTETTLPALKSILQSETGKKCVPYPHFSSKTVNGKPLFQYALEGTLDTIRIPVHEERIYRVRLTHLDTITKQELEERVTWLLERAPRDEAASKRLGADFRQDAVREAWSKVFRDSTHETYTVLSLRVTCASGTYMRSLAERIGTALGSRALALSIRRTKIGRYLPLLRMWLKTYR